MNVRSRLKELGWIAAVIGPLVLVWILSHPRKGPFGPESPKGPSIQRGPDLRPGPSTARGLPTLSGEVVDPEGNPVADAVVQLVDPQGRGDVLAPGRSREIRDREARTDSSGRFRFDRLPPGQKVLIARPPGRAPASTEPFLLEDDVHRRLVLPRPVSLTGLTNPRATLTFQVRVPGVPHAGHAPLAPSVVADEGGAYRIDGLPPALSFTVHVEAPGYRGRAFGPYQFPTGRHFLDFDLDTGRTLKGTVRDRAGKPVPGALIVFDDARATTDAEGAFTLAGLEERTTALVASRDGYIQTVLPSVRPGSVEITLPRAAEVSGRVMGGRARYLCFTLGDARYRLGLTDSETFRIPAVPPGPLRLDVEDENCRLLGSVFVDAPEGGCVEGVEILLR